jgi:hypothetical protein
MFGRLICCRYLSLSGFVLRAQIFALVLWLPSFLFAQSGPALSYSTYLPKINFNFQSFPQKGFSANSTGAACVTDGIALYGYDANGNVVFTVTDIFAVAKVKPASVFQDEQGNCFVAGRGPRPRLD